MSEAEEKRLGRRCDFAESYYSAIKNRINLQTIGEAILNGGEVSVDLSSFEERGNRAFEKLENYLVEGYGQERAEKVIDEVTAYCAIIENIYFSLGMKAGATLLIKLTDNFETDV